MARGRSGARKGLGRIRSTGGEALQLVIDYVKQETLDPLKGLGRFIAFGVAGSVALAIGLVVLSISFLRFLQTETDGAFDGNLSWLPYVICSVVLVLVAAIAVRAVSRGQAEPRTNPRRRLDES